ncbi:MAG: glycosyltransferase family 4 protein [Thermoguttaceae bacterium]
MRIMEIVSGVLLNGAMGHAALLIRELVKRGHEITLLCLPNSWIAENLAEQPVQMIFSDMRRFPPGELMRISSEIKRRGIEVVHSHMSRAHFFGILLRWFAGVPSVATAHSQYFQLHWMFNDLVIAVSDATRRFHRRFNMVSSKRIVTIRNFIDPEFAVAITGDERRCMRAALGASEGDLLLGIVGSVFQIKGHLQLIRVLPRIAASIENVRLAIVGEERVPEYGAYLRKEAERLGVADRIVWTGQHSDVPRVMDALDICVVASHRETLSMVTLEAMSAGIPVVASSVGGIRECVVHGETGLLVPPRDSEALGQALIELLRDPARRQTMGTAGHRRVHEHFSAETQAPLIETAFQHVCGKRRQPQFRAHALRDARENRDSPQAARHSER